MPRKVSKESSRSTTRAASTFSSSWRAKAQGIITVCADYHWFMHASTGSLRADDDPSSAITDPDTHYECPLVLTANTYRLRRGEAPLLTCNWEEAAEELGLNDYEAKVFFTTQEIAERVKEYACRTDTLSASYIPRYWSPWLRAQLEKGLLLYDK